MRVSYRSSRNLPAGVSAALVEGEHETVLLIAEHANGADIAAALDEVVPQWVADVWMYVGRCIGTIDLAA